ncbi:MAG: acyl carrier protein [Planctomycetota bacterium]
MGEAIEDLEGRIAELMVERLFLKVPARSIGREESLTLKYGVDSVRLFDLVVGMEEDFGVSFADDELTLPNFDTLARIASRIRAKREGGR